MTRKEQKEAKKIQIIQATLDLFVERGYYEGDSVRRTGKYRFGRNAAANADQGKKWFGFLLSIYQNVVFTSGKKYFYCKNVCIYGVRGAG